MNNLNIHSSRSTWNLAMPDNNDLKRWFSQCIQENMDSLYAMGLRLTRNNADAEDLLAECVVKAWSAIHSLDDKTRFRPWVFRILHNCFISDYRKKKCRPIETTLDEPSINDDSQEVAALLVQQPDEFLNWWANPEREFANNLLGEQINKAIESLPENFRITVQLINVEGLSYDEAASILNVSPGTIRSRMNRGRTLLQKALWEQAMDAGLVKDDTMLEKKI